MKRVVVYLSCFLGACNAQTPTNNTSPPSSGSQFAYQVVGGKSGAPVELLSIDCENKLMTLSRHTQGKMLIYKHQSPIDSTQCMEAAGLAASLCNEGERQQSNVFDAAGYELMCSNGGGKNTVFKWQGTLRASPEGLRPWHDYTRSLISSSFSGKNVYP